MSNENIKPIGGYFELELPFFTEYHSNAIALNGGRFCLEYLLKCRNYQNVYVPYYTCDSVIEPIKKLGIRYTFYHINKDMHISDDIHLKQNEAIIYTNYWGLQNAYCNQLVQYFGKQLILDYTQAFYSYPIERIDTFYSCRKFFGVPDGGYLYTDCDCDLEIKQDTSFTRMNSLIKRIDLSPEAGYEDFHQINNTFHHTPMCRMSNFTKRMMSAINYKKIATQRKKNYNILREYLGGKELETEEVPMIFPYTTERGQELRSFLIKQKVFIAKYWPNVNSWTEKDSTEAWLANHVLPLPIDQRYNHTDMKRIINLILA